MTTHLPSVPYPRLDALFRLGEDVWLRRPDVREAFGSVTSWEYWCWMMFSGAAEHAELLAAIYPLPGSTLAARVAGSVSDAEFARNGVVDCNRVHRSLAEAGFDFGRPARVLDFGCGCGRLIRVMARHADSISLFGADVDAEAVAWCSTNLDFATFDALPFAPPSRYESGMFDAVYSYSVFSHLPEQLQFDWLDELARVCAPGALAVVTTQGRKLVELILSRQLDLVPTSEDLRARLPELEGRGFLFFPFEQLPSDDASNVAFFADWDLTQYGMTFILESYVREKWLTHFDLVAYHEAPEGYQDFIVLRRR